MFIVCYISLNTTTSIEQKYIKNSNAKTLIAFFAKKMLIKLMGIFKLLKTRTLIILINSLYIVFFLKKNKYMFEYFLMYYQQRKVLCFKTVIAIFHFK